MSTLACRLLLCTEPFGNPSAATISCCNLTIHPVFQVETDCDCSTMMVEHAGRHVWHNLLSFLVTAD